MHPKNNFDFLRFLFASFVIITHAYPLTGMPECDAVCNLTNGQLSFSYIGVKGFFILSGYLIFQSLERSSSLKNYFWKRLLRLYPALFVTFLLIVLLAPFVYDSIIPYWKNKQVWTYLPMNLLIYKGQYRIAGVFENNPYPQIINGSFWTIQYEFTMYLLLGALYSFRRNKKLIIALLLGILFVFIVCDLVFTKQSFKYAYVIKPGFNMGAYFICGSILSVLKIEKIKYQSIILAGVLFLFFIAIYFNFFEPIKYLVFPLLIILIGLKGIPYIQNFGKKMGDLSYGIYLYGFPVQQTLMHFFKFTHLQLMFYGLVISISLGFLSWHIIEKKALKYKDSF